MLYAQGVLDGCIPCRHPSLLSMTVNEIWDSFYVARLPCVYSIVSMAHKEEYLGTTVNWRSRCYQHARHILNSGLGDQPVHAFVRSYKHEYVFLPLSRCGGAALESRLIKT
jgi:hypothetical protein